MSLPARSKSSQRIACVASSVPLPGRARPMASLRQFMLLAVNMPEHDPHVGHAERSISASSASLTFALLEAIKQWEEPGTRRKIHFTTLSKYVDTILPGVQSGAIQIPTHQGGTAYDFDAFWMDTPCVKTLYRSCEQGLQAAESLATIASLTGHYAYPSQSLYESWTLMFLNMDRNTLWGSAGGMVFLSRESWDVQDRFNWVADSAAQVQTVNIFRPISGHAQILTMEL